MRTHHFSIAIDAFGVSDRSIAIVRKIYSRGVLQDAEIIYGPVRVGQLELVHVLVQQLKLIEERIAQERGEDVQDKEHQGANGGC
jgi:hypothetical protein